MFQTELTDLLRRRYTVSFVESDGIYFCTLIDFEGDVYNGRGGDSVYEALSLAVEKMQYLSRVEVIEQAK